MTDRWYFSFPMDFSQIPFAVCLEIFALLPILDVIHVRSICRVVGGMENAEAACAITLDPVKYLDQKFGRGAQLLLAMARSNVYLSGSRALDFFVPGTADEASDWDFYIPSEPIEVYKFMKAMEELGVKWMSNADLMKEVATTPGKRATIRLTTKAGGLVENVNSLDQVAGLMRQHTDLPVETKSPFNWHSDSTESAVILNQGDCICVKLRPMDYHVEGIEVLNGRYEWNGRKANVQLIIADVPFLGLHHFLAQFHSSCVQCFISPAGAVHLYGKMASRHQSHIWLHDKQALPQDFEHAAGDARVLKPCDTFLDASYHWAKYRQRGFEYSVAPSMAASRGYFSLRDGARDGTILVKIDCGSVPEHIHQWYDYMFDKIRWDESVKKIIFRRIACEQTYFIDWFDDVPREVVVEYFENTVGRLLSDLTASPDRFSRPHDNPQVYPPEEYFLR